MEAKKQESKAILAELKRIFWRQKLLSTQTGRDWFCEMVKKGAKEKELGSHRTDAPTLENK